jgi:hypothetical protein
LVENTSQWKLFWPSSLSGIWCQLLWTYAESCHTDEAGEKRTEPTQ